MPPNFTVLDADKHRATTIYIIIGVVIGLVIVSFIGCMITIRHWVALKNKLSRKIWFSVESPIEAEELKEGHLSLTSKTPDTELESQATPVKSTRLSSG
jgi:hypothetical protein